MIGVLGGIASGKSRVAERLAGVASGGQEHPRQGDPPGVVLDADRFAHEALRSEPVRARLRERFGPGVFGADGEPDREALGRLVFTDPAARAALEGWIHPIVRRRLAAELAAARSRDVSRVVLDVPLLIENDARHGLASWCDVLVFVDSSAADREARAMASRGWPSGEVARREALQHPLAEKRDLAQYVIENRGTPEELDAEVRRVLRELGLA